MDAASWKKPRALRPGARVALVAPAGPIAPERIAVAVERCHGMGLEPVVYPGAERRLGFLAGPDDCRLSDLQGAFDDRAIDAVWALRGGYGSQRIIDSLDLSRQHHDPIPFIGFSDNTAVLARLATMRVISFHGPHGGSDLSAATEASLTRVLCGKEAAGELPCRPTDPAVRKLVPGVAEGRLVGGNLAMLASSIGTRDALVARERILLLEDVGEAAYRIDRMLLQLERSGALDGLAGLACGHFTEVPGNDKSAVDSVLADFANKLGVPAALDLPFGHVESSWTLPIGATASLDADRGRLTLTEAAVV